MMCAFTHPTLLRVGIFLGLSLLGIQGSFARQEIEVDFSWEGTATVEVIEGTVKNVGLSQLFGKGKARDEAEARTKAREAASEILRKEYQGCRVLETILTVTLSKPRAATGLNEPTISDIEEFIAKKKFPHFGKCSYSKLLYYQCQRIF